MSVLARYKKPGGFKQLLQLIETSQPEKQAKLLDVVEKETPEWAALITEKKLDPQMVMGWEPDHLVFIFENMSARHCSCLFKAHPELKLENYSTWLKPEKYRDLKNLVDDNTHPSPGEVTAAYNNMLEAVRMLDEEKVIDLKLIDPKLDLSEAA